LKQHREKYAETALAQEYYKKKKELEEIQNRVLKQSEKYKLKEDACLDIPGTTIINAFTVEPIGSALHIKSAVQKSSNFPHCKVQTFFDFYVICSLSFKTFEETTEDQNNSKMIEGKNQKSLEKPKEFKERIFEESEHPSLLNEKHQLYKPLHVPCIPRKFVQSVQSIRFSMQQTETGREEKEKPMELSVATSSSSSLSENSSQ
ncbi:S6OS1 protein, partial [Hydrobates tethys]|nr:S6OS1 protein [Oceanodroma tethys]